MRALILTLFFLLALVCALYSQSYIGWSNCDGHDCHDDEVDDFLESGHHYALYKNNGSMPSNSYWPYTDRPPLPSVNGQQLQWSDVEFMVGNFYWKTNFVDETGMLITGNQNDSTQYSVMMNSWSQFYPGETQQFDCGRCHTTGYNANGSMSGYPNIQGSWVYEGVECEACHGPCSIHAYYYEIPTPGGKDCEDCHYRDRENRLIWENGFVLDRQEASELAVGGHEGVLCMDCHDNHRSTVYDQGGIPNNYSCNSCDGGHGGAEKQYEMMDGVMEDLDCIDCHMPYMDYSGGTVNEYKADVRSHLMGILPIPITREENIITIQDTTFWQVDPFLGRAAITLDYACLSCHIDNGYPITIEEAAEFAQFRHNIRTLNIELNEDQPGLVLPASGGNVDYEMRVSNIDLVAHTVHFFVQVTDPTGNQDIIFNVADTLLSVNATLTYNLSEFISAGSPGGDYFFRAYIFNQGYPNAEDFDVFKIEKDGGTLPLSITLTPYNVPIVVPANGGTFSYNIAGSNSGISPETFDLWTMVTLPNGSEYGPILNVPDLTLNAGASINRDRTQAVPSAAPAGNYTYDAYIGNYPNQVLAEDHFDFSKSAVSDGFAIVNGWINSGQDFPMGDAAGSILTPDEFTIKAFPNPFNAETVISYTLPGQSDVQLKIYDTQGREAVNLVNGYQTSGNHQVTFSGANLSSGVYYIMLSTQYGKYTEKVLLIK